MAVIRLVFIESRRGRKRVEGPLAENADSMPCQTWRRGIGNVVVVLIGFK